MPSIATKTVTLTIADRSVMAAYVAVPEQPSGAAMLVLQEAFGVTRHIRSVADRFAAQGYLAIAPELFHRTAPQGFEGPYADFKAVAPHCYAITEDGLSADLEAAFAWLKAQPGTVQDLIGCIGFCMGGRAAFLANALLPIKAAVSAYGGGVAPDLLHLATRQSDPLMLIWGGIDKHIDEAQRSAVRAALVEAGKDFSDTLYAKADHGFFCPDRPAYNATASSQGWSAVDAFFKLHLCDFAALRASRSKPREVTHGSL